MTLTAALPLLSHAARATRHALIALAIAPLWAPHAGAQTPPATASSPALDATVVEARDAARKRDRARLAAARAALQAGQHPLTPWVEYWDLAGRLNEATVDEVEAFYARWPGSYVEDRLRNDWLQELGRRRDWANLARDYPRFRMNYDREVTCWWLFTEHLAGRDVREAGRAAWLAQREADEGCNLLATALFDARRLDAEDVYRKARLAVEQQRPAAARAAIGLLGNPAARQGAEALDHPLRLLRAVPGLRLGAAPRLTQEIRLLAVMRLAQTDADAAALHLDAGALHLSAGTAAWGWAYLGRQAAFRLAPEAAGHYQRAWALLKGEQAAQPGWSDDTLAWGVRALLRSNAAPAQRWPLVLRSIDAMSADAQRDPAWIYWKARALQATAPAGADGEARRAEAAQLLAGIAGPLNFYAKLAAEDLGRTPALPPAPAPLSAAERAAAAQHPGLQRALLLAALGLRDEARREWNFSLRGLDDRALLAAARLACDRSDWQLCINTAERTRSEVDTSLRYPMPYAADIQRAAQDTGLDPALVFGLIRQETRFMPQLRSSAGASGLMQVMPATARWVAKKIGLDWRDPEQIHDPLVNLKLGTSYLKLVLDDLGGSQAMAAAAYNAGPGRPRRWREGATLEAAAWAEGIPFNETRDYVKKVLSNAAVYASLLDGRQPPALRPRLGQTIGPRAADAPASNAELP